MDSSVLKSKTAIFGGSFDPPGNHHIKIIQSLTEIFPFVIVIPCGPRPDREFYFKSPELRIELATAAFSEIPNVSVDLSDIRRDRFSYTFDLDQRLKSCCEPVHVIGADLIAGGATNSPIVRSWHRGKEVWNGLNFLLLARPEFPLDENDLPPHSSVLRLDIKGSSTAIRDALISGRPISDLVPDAVEKLVRRTH